tara:strand:- start:379 stop:573 length:195 start_codon:yes stop_codon:yes gene_type:complete
LGLVQHNKPPQRQTSVVDLKDKLDNVEIGIILTLIKQSTFKGEDLEIVYNMVIKLQKQLKNVQS